MIFLGSVSKLFRYAGGVNVSLLNPARHEINFTKIGKT